MRASQRKQTPEVGQASGQMLAGPEGASVSTSRGSPRAAFACCADGQKPVEAGQGSAPGRHHCAHRGLSPSSGSSVSSLSPLRPPRSADRAGLAHAQDSRTLWCHNCRWGARRAGSPRDPTQPLCAPRGPGLGPCSWPSASALPVSVFLTHRIFSLPHLGLLEQILPLSPVAAASAATCLGSLALFVRPVCWGLSSRAVPDSPSLPLSGSLSPLLASLRAHPGCYGNAASGTRWWLGAGSQECRSRLHFRCQAPSRRGGGGSWSGVGGTRGLPRPRRFLLGRGRWQEGRYEHGSEDIRWCPGWGRGG